MVQRTSATTGPSTSNSLTATFPVASAGHHLLVLTATTDGGDSEPLQSIDDGTANRWVSALDVGFFNSGTMELDIWFASNAGPVTSVTASWAPFTGHLIMNLYEFGAAARSSTLDGFSTGSQTGEDTSCTSTPVFPTAPGDLAVGLLVGDVRQDITVTSPGFKNAKRLSAGRALTMRSGTSVLPTTSPVTYGGSSTVPMAWSCFVTLFRPR